MSDIRDLVTKVECILRKSQLYWKNGYLELRIEMYDYFAAKIDSTVKQLGAHNRLKYLPVDFWKFHCPQDI